MPKDIVSDTRQMARSRMVTMRKPESTDGSAIWELVRSCKPLDENSMYCNLIQADHFRDTCVVAEEDGQILGWISGHLIPAQDAFFVWQVAVSPKARGLGLGKQMLRHLTEREELDDAEVLKTTITEDNDASWGLFRSFAREIGGELDDEPHFLEDDHFDGAHDTEHMVTITLKNDAEEAALNAAA
ncbi:diaminobutyrate acetyltransferase [Mangrovicoccus ximenensis]|uniref:diaminobutyrate acetyltransferase n=1 Tax=Mangrovicoccus ximenensis TaxID=1911570 RepID=UPI000D38390A|nr:diaminobutyrate acetyltransferase [Mangrovicoccus ximenensis]